MAYRLFEGKDHASIYQRYRFAPPKGLNDVIIQYLDKKVKRSLQPYTSNPVAVADNKLEELYSAIPFPDKERIDCFQAKFLISVSNLVGFIQSCSMYQAYMLKDPKGAEDLLFNTQKRSLAHTHSGSQASKPH